MINWEPEFDNFIKQQYLKPDTLCSTRRLFWHEMGVRVSIEQVRKRLVELGVKIRSVQEANQVKSHKYGFRENKLKKRQLVLEKRLVLYKERIDQYTKDIPRFNKELNHIKHELRVLAGDYDK